MPKYAWILNGKVAGIIDADASYVDNCGGEWYEINGDENPKVTIGLIFNNITQKFEE